MDNNESNLPNYEKITMYPDDDNKIKLEKEAELDEKIQKAIKEQEKDLTNLKYVIVKSNSNYIFFSLLFLFFVLLGFYIYFKISSQKIESDNSQKGNNFNFYNHTGWSEITPLDPTCNLYSLERIGDEYIVEYKNPKSGKCLDSYLITGTPSTRRTCTSDKCIDFKGQIVNFGTVETFVDPNGTTPFPTCNLDPCDDKIYRILSFVDNEPFCATITYNIDNNDLDPQKTAFLPCDPLDRNQLFRITRKSSYSDNNEKGSLLDIISRTTQEYLFINTSGVLSSKPNPPGQSWLYTPTIQITNDIIIPSQLVYMDYAKLNEFPNYNPLNELSSNIINIPQGYNYTQILTNLYSISNFGYLSARQYQQFCLLGGIGNKACYHELMILSESDYQLNVKNNSLKYEYTGDL